jgi:hypothetical protein
MVGRRGPTDEVFLGVNDVKPALYQIFYGAPM